MFCVFDCVDVLAVVCCFDWFYDLFLYVCVVDLFVRAFCFLCVYILSKNR